MEQILTGVWAYGLYQHNMILHPSHLDYPVPILDLEKAFFRLFLSKVSILPESINGLIEHVMEVMSVLCKHTNLLSFDELKLMQLLQILRILEII